MRRYPSETFCTRKNVLLTLHVAGVSNVLSPSVTVIFNTHRHIHVLKDDSLVYLRQLSRDRMVAISLAKYFKGVKCSNKNMKKKNYHICRFFVEINLTKGESKYYSQNFRIL
jgi:hypothetical protein